MDQTRRKRAAVLGAVATLAMLASLGFGGTPAAAAGTTSRSANAAATKAGATGKGKPARPAATAAPRKPVKAKPARAKASGTSVRLARNGYATHLDAEFVESTIRDHGSSGLILTVKRDPDVTPAHDLTGLGFTIELPEHLMVGSNDVDNTCAQSTFTPDYGDGQLVVSGIEMDASESQCTLGVVVTSRHSGTYTINNATVTDTTGNLGAEITPDNLVVTPAPPRLTAYFDDDDIVVGGTTDLSFYLYRSDENPATVTSGIAWRLTLPVGLVVTAAGNNTCGGTTTATTGTRIYTISGGVLGAGDSHCEATVTVRADAGGTFTLPSETLTGLKKVEAAFGACLASVPAGGPSANAVCTPTLDVEKLPQTVTFAQPEPRKVGDSKLTATTSSGLTAGFTSSTTAVCTVVGSTLRVKTEGVCKVTAVQNGSAVYASAHSEERTIEILPRPPAPPTVDGLPGQSSITVNWTAPAETGAIVDYVASARSGDIVSSCTSTTLTCVLGAVAGRPYTLMVVSRGPNGVSVVTTGTNTVTATAPVVPQAPPETDLDLTTTDGRITEAAPGQEITFVGTGFAPFSTVVITIYSKPTVLGTAITDAKGDFVKAVTMPSDLAMGAHTAVAQGVAPDGTPRAMALGITVDGLPVTGPGVATLLLMGAGVVVAGAGLMLIGRPRRRPVA